MNTRQTKWLSRAKALNIGILSALLGLLASPASALTCNDGCFIGNVGLGGAYYSLGAPGVSSYGGYIGAETRYYTPYRLQSVFGTRLGAGQTSSDTANSSSLGIFDYYVKLGVNVAGESFPLYINLLYERNNHDGQAWGGRGLERDISLLGAELEGAIPFQQGFNLDYSAGYAYLSRGRYILDDRSAEIGRGGYVISASLGFTRDINERNAFYAKLIGKYQSLNTASYRDGTQGYPASNDFIAMLELGFKGF